MDGDLCDLTSETADVRGKENAAADELYEERAERERSERG